MKTNICKWSLIWNVITLSKPLTKVQKTAIKRIDYFALITDNAILSHGGVSKLTERVEKMLEIVGARKEKSIRFTDKQYGLSINSYNGVAIPNPALSQEVVVKSGQIVTTIPVTKMQIANAK